MKKYLTLLLSIVFLLPIQSGENKQNNIDFSDVQNRHDTIFMRAVCSFHEVIERGYPQRDYDSEAKDFRKDLLKSKSEVERKLGLLAVASQLEVGIPLKKRLPIEMFYRINPNYHAAASPYSIVFNERYLSNKNIELGKFRATCLHEAMHVVCRDPMLLGRLWGLNLNKLVYFEMLTLGVCCLLDSEMLAKSFGISHVLYFYLNRKMRNTVVKYVEQRADIGAFSKLQCYQCAHEASKESCDEEGESKYGYMSNVSAALFVDRYKQAGVLCPFHARRDGQTVSLQELSEEELRDYLEQVAKNQGN